MAKNTSIAPTPEMVNDVRTPDATIYTIDVSFNRLADRTERDYLNELPTSFSLSPEAVEQVDRLRAAAATIIEVSPEFLRLLKDVGADVKATSSRGGAESGAPATKRRMHEGHAVSP